MDIHTQTGDTVTPITTLGEEIAIEEQEKLQAIIHPSLSARATRYAKTAGAYMRKPWSLVALAALGSAATYYLLQRKRLMA